MLAITRIAAALFGVLATSQLLAQQLVLTMQDEPDGRAAVVTAIGLSPDGSRIVAGGDDHCLRVWDSDTGELVSTLRGHDDWVHAARFLPENQIASAASDHTLKLWEPAGQLESSASFTAGGPLSAIAISPDGQRIATTGFGDEVRVFRTEEDHPPTLYDAPSEDTRAVAFSPDGRWLAAAGRNGVVRLWDLVSSGGPRDLSGDGRRVRALAFSPSGDMLAAGGDGPAVRFWRLGGEDRLRDTPEEILTRPGKTHSLTFVDDRLLAVGGTSDTIRLWDVELGSPRGELEGHTGTVTAMAVSEDGGTLVSGAFDATVRLWDLNEQDGRRTASRVDSDSTAR